MSGNLMMMVTLVAAASGAWADTETVAGYLADGTAYSASSVAAQKLVKGADKLNDWANCTNAANVKVNFTWATGVVSGTFDLWYEGNNAKDAWEQTTTLYKSLKHYGVFVPYRREDGILEDEVWTTGFFLAPQKIKCLDAKGREQTRTWNGSYRFDVKAVKAERDWSE